MTDLPPLPEAATAPYPIQEAPHAHPAGPNGEPIQFAMDADEPEPARLTGEAKALLGVFAAIAVGAVTAIAATFFRRQPEPQPAPKRRAARKPAARKPAARKSTRRTATA